MMRIGFVLVLIFSAQTLAKKCVFRGKCGEKSAAFGTYPVPCVVDEDPKPLPSSAVNQAMKFVPELFDNITDPVFCCDGQQVDDIITQNALAESMLKQCPSCFVNFVKIFFHMSCNPNQAQFLEVTNKTKSTIDPNKEMITELSYNMAEEFGQSVFNSCKNLKMSSGDHVINVFCGGDTDCTLTKFLAYIGQKALSPFQIDFHLTDGKSGLNQRAIPCNEAPAGYSNLTCSCADCPVACGSEL